MKIIPNLITANTQIVRSKSNQSFGQNPIESDSDTKQVSSMPSVSPDYNVSVPMEYSFVEDIKLPNDLVAKCYKLANGQKVIVVPKKNGPTVVQTFVNTGSLNEPDNLRGISHFIEHNLFNGSDSLGDKVFFDEVNKMGADTNASTSLSSTNYFISSNLLDDKDFENTIKLHAGMIQSPKFLLDKLSKEKKIVDSEINMCMSDDENMGFTTTLKNVFGIKSKSEDLVAGTTDNIDALTRDDVVNYFNNNYYPANMVTVISGEAEPDETMKLVSKYFTSRKTPSKDRYFEPLIPIESTVRKDIISKKSDERAKVFLGFKGPENSNTKDQIDFEALTYLFAGLDHSRDFDLAIKYNTSDLLGLERLEAKPSANGMALIQSSVSEENVEPYLKDLYKLVDNLSKNPPSEFELTAIKNRLKKKHETIYESSDRINRALGYHILDNDMDSIKNYDKLIDSMTSQDIANVAKKYLDLNKVAITVVHPSSAKQNDIIDNHKKASSVSFTGLTKKDAIDLGSVSEYKLPNNYDVVLNNSNSDNVEFSYDLTKKYIDPKKASVPPILFEILSDAGTKSKTEAQISELKDFYGISMENFVTDSNLGLNASLPSKNVDKMLNLLKDYTFNLNITPEEFEKAKKRVEDRYSTIEANEYDAFDKIMHKGTMLEYSPKDVLDSLKNVTIEDVLNSYNDILSHSQGKITVTGPFSKHPELKNLILNSFSQYPSVSPKNTALIDLYKPIDKTQVFTVENNKNQAKILEGFKFKHNGNMKDELSIKLLNEILGGSPSSRLFSDLREKRHLAYVVSSDIQMIENYGVMSLKIATTTENQETGANTFDNIEKSIKGFNENIEKIKTEKVTDEELENAKKTLKSGLLSSLEMNYDKNSALHSYSDSLYGLNGINEKLAMIDSITSEDLLNTAKYIFKSEPVYSISGTKSSLDANKTFLDSLQEK